MSSWGKVSPFILVVQKSASNVALAAVFVLLDFLFHNAIIFPSLSWSAIKIAFSPGVNFRNCMRG